MSKGQTLASIALPVILLGSGLISRSQAEGMIYDEDEVPARRRPAADPAVLAAREERLRREQEAADRKKAAAEEKRARKAAKRLACATV